MRRTIKGQIEINLKRKTVSINLKNGSCCSDCYTHGVKRFLDEEIRLELNKIVKKKIVK